MRHTRSLTTLPLLGGLLLAACQDGEPTAPVSGKAFLTQDDVMALDVVTFDGGIEAALALAEGPVATMARRGMGAATRTRASDDTNVARRRFQEAAGLLERRDSAGAAERAREARRLVARAGQSAVRGFAAGMVERIDALAGQVAQDPDAFVDADRLRAELNGLAEQARRRLHQNDSLGAADRGVLAEQRTRQRQRPGHGGIGGGGGDVAVALGASAVALATRILDEQGADDEQIAYLETASEYQRAAEAALEAGDVSRAIHLAELAEWAALEAVVLPGGVTDEEARAMLELAESQYGQAAASDLSKEEMVLLKRARGLIDHGAAALESGSVRGVVPLWRAAVICSWIAG